MKPCPIARLIASLGILLLGAVAARRVGVAFLPTWSFPELGVHLQLPHTTDIPDLTRRWIVPLETSIRAMGEVRSVTGWVDGRGGRLRVRFRPGTDAERKAARLESELNMLRRELPTGTYLGVRPAGQGGGDQAVFLWLGHAPQEPDDGDSPVHPPLDRSFVEAVRSLPEVRSVTVYGESRREIEVTPKDSTAAATLRQAIAGRLATRRLGEAQVAGRRLSVLVRGARNLPLGELAIRRGESLLPLNALADVRLGYREASMIARVDGRRGLVLQIDREYESSPLALERSLRRLLRDFGLEAEARLLVNEADPLRKLLERFAIGALVAILAAGILARIFGGWRATLCQVLALPVALAAVLNGLWLAGISLDVTTLPVVAVALGCGLFFLALRAGNEGAVTAPTVAVSAALVPVTVALAGGQLAPFLAAPARAFAVAQIATVLALWILPLPAPAEVPPAGVARLLRFTLRNPWGFILGAVTGTYALFVFFGTTLAPRSGTLSPAFGDLGIRLSFAEGTTPAQAEEQIVVVESHLNSPEEIAEHFSIFHPRGGSIYAQVRPEDRRLSRLRPLAARLAYQLNFVGASAQVTPLAGRSLRGAEPLRFTDDVEDRAEADRDAYYRFILRSTDFEVLRAAHAHAVDKLTAMKIGFSYLSTAQIRSEWGRPSPRVELVPRPGVAPDDLRRAAQALSARAAQPPTLPVDDDLDLRVADRQAPRSPDEVPQRAELLGLRTTANGTATSPAALFKTREVLASPWVKRQAGRFVLPVTVQIHGVARRFRAGTLWRIDQRIRTLPLPAGCNPELPTLNPLVWGPERLRMLGIAGAFPLLVLGLAICHLNSIRLGLVAVAPLVVGVALATPWIRMARGNVDELTLLCLAAVVAGSLPLVLQVTARTRVPYATPLAGGIAYRWLARRVPGMAVAGVGMVLLLAIPGIGLDADRHAWVMPMRTAAMAGAGVLVGSALLLPVLLRTGVRLRDRGRQRRRRRATLDAWLEPGCPELAARNLTKVYRDGFTALRAVDFHLRPGIVGLLGPNGAGKTTLMRLLCGLLEPSRGQVRFRGIAVEAENMPAYRRLVGFLPQAFNAYEGFTGEQFLDYWALERGIRSRRARRREIERLLVQVGLEDAAGRKVRDFSGGMRRRIGIARALIGEPPIVIVDEPTTGLDVEARHRLRESLLAVAGERIILFSTHIPSDVAAAALRILLLHQGRLLFDGAAGELVARARGRVFETLIGDRELREFSHRYRVTARVRTLDGIRVRAVTVGGEEPAGEPVEPNLEEAYLAVIGDQGPGWSEARRGHSASLLDLERWRGR